MKKQKLPKTTHDLSGLLSPEELAAHLDVSVRTLANWRATGLVCLPFVKVGRCVRYRLEDVDKYLSRCTFNLVEEVAK